MKRIACVVLFALALGLGGCGGGKSELNTKPLTDEEKRKIKENDQKVDEEEGRAYKPKKGK